MTSPAEREPHRPAEPSSGSSARPAGRGVRMPPSALAALADRALQAGRSATSALREAGRLTGEDLYRATGATARDQEGPDLQAFWSRANGRLEELGLGRAEYRPLSASVGLVTLRESPEAGGRGGDREETRPGCPFATGWIAGLVSRAAGEPAAVLEVRCSAGEDRGPCRFLVGAEERLEEIRRRLRAGASPGDLLTARAGGPGAGPEEEPVPAAGQREAPS